ncbi:hypothetical protein LguiA_011541 [Lonicera macranthoides]
MFKYGRLTVYDQPRGSDLVTCSCLALLKSIYSRIASTLIIGSCTLYPKQIRASSIKIKELNRKNLHGAHVSLISCFCVASVI